MSCFMKKKAKWELSHSFPILFGLSKLLISFEIGTTTLVVLKKKKKGIGFLTPKNQAFWEAHF